VNAHVDYSRHSPSEVDSAIQFRTCIAIVQTGDSRVSTLVGRAREIRRSDWSTP